MYVLVAVSIIKTRVGYRTTWIYWLFSFVLFCCCQYFCNRAICPNANQNENENVCFRFVMYNVDNLMMMVSFHPCLTHSVQDHISRSIFCSIYNRTFDHLHNKYICRLTEFTPVWYGKFVMFARTWNWWNLCISAFVSRDSTTYCCDFLTRSHQFAFATNLSKYSVSFNTPTANNLFIILSFGTRAMLEI